MKENTYPSDVTDEQWSVVGPLIPPARRGGRPRSVDMRDVIDAVFYVDRTGCQWRYLPHDFPPWQTVYHYFRLWRIDGTWRRIHDALRRVVREGETDHPPRTASIDSQSVKTTEVGGERGYDGGKKVNGRKRHIVVDSLGLLLAVAVTAASVPEAVAARDVLRGVTARQYPGLGVLYADAAYERYGLPEWVSKHRRYELEVVRRPDGSAGFVPLAVRWLVERTFGWLGRYRRLSKDYERLTQSSEAMIRVSMIHRMTQRLKPRPNQYPDFKYKRG